MLARGAGRREEEAVPLDEFSASETKSLLRRRTGDGTTLGKEVSSRNSLWIYFNTRKKMKKKKLNVLS